MDGEDRWLTDVSGTSFQNNLNGMLAYSDDLVFNADSVGFYPLAISLLLLSEKSIAYRPSDS